MYTPPVTPWKLATPEAVTPTLVEEDVEGGADDWGEVVTRYPYRKVRMDHLLTGRQTMILMSEYFILRPKSCHLRSIGTSALMAKISKQLL